MAALDHIAVSAMTLAEGVAHVEAALGLPLAGGGQHPLMGTHNRLMGLGPDYLEVIAIDPAAVAPSFPRWFDLDRFQGPPRLTTWICRADLDAAPPEAGRVLDLARGDLRWRMAVPESGILPHAGSFPALIQWQGSAHPAQRLPDSGARLTRLEIATPDPQALQRALGGFADPRVVIAAGAPAMQATFSTPHGTRLLR
ncbi:VOC family protein [Gemmobacter serpentinus]|uniref:VOC family protein n=1 Tax=Gemmobacter serpentinus TaxID=2652247 RepID=UPI00124CC283|nr:VOC family protein [Gemmobacter serpentinus]